MHLANNPSIHSSSHGFRTRQPFWGSIVVGEDGQAAGERNKRVHSASTGKLSGFETLLRTKLISLWQLVVVGDQSSGKSSVLEGLTELPFPRDSTLCTRFATQIVFRRAEQESVNVSIIPSPSSDAPREKKLKAFKEDGLKALSAEDFSRILAKVPLQLYQPRLHAWAKGVQGQ